MAGFSRFTVNLITVYLLSEFFLCSTLVVYVDDLHILLATLQESTVKAFLLRGLNKGCGNLCYFVVIEVARNKSISVYRNGSMSWIF